jgi:hypothetical protein
MQPTIFFRVNLYPFKRQSLVYNHFYIMLTIEIEKVLPKVFNFIRLQDFCYLNPELW